MGQRWGKRRKVGRKLGKWGINRGSEGTKRTQNGGLIVRITGVIREILILRRYKFKGERVMKKRGKYCNT